MGFFDEIGSLVNDISSLGEELKQPLDEAVQSVSESTEELKAVKDDLLSSGE